MGTRFPSWLPFAVVAGFLLLGFFDAWWIYSLRADLNVVRGTLQSRQWQVTEESEKQDLADIHLFILDSHDPATRDPAFSAARIAVAWDGRFHRGTATMRNFPAPPAGHDYQLWVLDPAAVAPFSAGLLNVTGGPQNFTVNNPGTDNVGFAVSIEPAGGSRETTGTILFAVAPGQ
jgi:hypothetical protein